MSFRTRLSSWSLPVLLFGVPVCAALALEHAGAAGQKAPPASALSAAAEARTSSQLDKTVAHSPRNPRRPGR